MISPYEGLPLTKWKEKTAELVRVHPLIMGEVIDVVLEAWE